MLNQNNLYQQNEQTLPDQYCPLLTQEEFSSTYQEPRIKIILLFFIFKTHTILQLMSSQSSMHVKQQ